MCVEQQEVEKCGFVIIYECYAYSTWAHILQNAGHINEFCKYMNIVFFERGLKLNSLAFNLDSNPEPQKIYLTSLNQT